MALASVGIIGCSKGGGSVATVNGEAISKETFHRYLELKPQAQVTIDLTTLQITPGQRSATVIAPLSLPLGFQALNDLIQRTVLMQEAKEENVAPTQADIEKELAFREEKSKKQQRDYIKELNNQGYTLGEIRSDIIAVDLVKQNLLTKGITITPTDVDDFIKRNPDQFKEPAQASLQVILVNGQDNRTKAENDLLSGQNFVAVAQHYSTQPNATSLGYHWPQTIISQFPKQLRDAVTNLQEGQQTGWLQTEGNSNQWIKFYVEKKQAEKMRTVDSTLKEDVRRFLALDRGQKAIDLNQRLQTRLIDAKIDIEDATLKGIWTRQMDEMKANLKKKDEAASSSTQAPPPSTTGTTAPTTSAATSAPATSAGASH